MQTVKSLSCSINLVEESYDSLQITVLEMEEIVFFHGGSCVFIFFFLLEDSGHYMDSHIFHHLGNKRRGEGNRALTYGALSLILLEKQSSL